MNECIGAGQKEVGLVLNMSKANMGLPHWKKVWNGGKPCGYLEKRIPGG